MKKTLLAATIAASLGLIGCSQPENTEKSAADKAAMMDAQNAELNQAELGSFGVDLSARNEAIKPGDEFFMYASGTWYDNYELPADKTRYGAFTALAERSEERVKNIVDGLLEKETLNDEEKLVHDFFVSYMDTDAINEKGLSPISDVLATIDNISTQKDLTEVFGNAWLTGASSPINSGMWYNRLDPNEYQLSVGVGGLGLPDRDYYLSDDERFVKIREAYEAHIAQMLGFAKVENPEEKAAEILALETEIANVQWPREKRRDRDLTLNQIERAKLSDDYPNFDWDTYFAQTGYKVPELNISQPEPVKAVIEIINDTALDKWKSYLTYHTIKNNAGLLSEDIYLANFDFYGTTLSGQQEPRPRWKRAVSQMSGTQSLGFAIGKIYVNEYFPESSKTQMAELVENLRTALGHRIDNVDWMSA